MSTGPITFHDVTPATFEAVQKTLLTDFGGERVNGGDSDLRCLGIQGALRYDEQTQSARLDISHLPSVLSRSTVVSWLYGAFTSEPQRIQSQSGGLYWDVLEVRMHNNTTLPLNVTNVPNLDHGIYHDYPATAVPGDYSELFTVSSVSGSEIGPQGSVAYGLADGTNVNINFDMEFAVGQVSTLTVATSGARNASYGVAAFGNHKSWHGQGTTWSVLLFLEPFPGATFAEHSYTR
jgi:hypothetical protein